MSPSIDFDAVPLNYLIDDVTDDNPPRITGLWLLPSCFRHSCLGTAYMAFYGDVAVVHALVDVKRGEEVTIIGDGVHPFDSYRERKCDIKAIMRRSGFSCTCRLCEFDRNDLLERKRRELVLSIDDHVRRAETRAVCVSAAVEAITRILHEIRATYSNQNVLRTQTYEPLKCLGHLYEWNGDYRKAIDCIEELIACLHASHLPLYGVRRYLQITRCYRKLGEDAMAHVWAQKARELHHIRTGSTNGLFKKFFPNFADLF
ncbi:TPR domain-containing protein [Aphelenchoides avenae]|nr:TPR domain-containing protein [Aphelenchus avenae]